MGYERKRGKLMAFNRFITEGETSPFILTAGNISNLSDIQYIITLDADTELPPDSAHKLIGTMAHILNRPVYDSERNIIVKGYGIMQPRIAINLQSSRYSLFARLFTNETGIDPYTRAVSDVYQDIFHQGSFVGKGIYDVKVFENVLAGRLPENKILSHDLLESTYLRSGLIADSEVFESYPASYLVDAKRRHRWIRGDWQILQWLFPKVPAMNGYKNNPLCGVNKWKIGDNLRRSLIAPFGLLFISGFLIWFPTIAAIAFLLFLAAFLLPFLFNSITELVRKPEEQSWKIHIHETQKNTIHNFLQALFIIATFPYEAFICADAIVRSLWRLTVSHKNLLQWQTFEEANKTTACSLGNFYGQMWFSPLFSALCLVLAFFYQGTFLYTLPFSLLWFTAPYICWKVSCPEKKKKWN